MGIVPNAKHTFSVSGHQCMYASTSHVHNFRLLRMLKLKSDRSWLCQKESGSAWIFFRRMESHLSTRVYTSFIYFAPIFGLCREHWESIAGAYTFYRMSFSERNPTWFVDAQQMMIVTFGKQKFTDTQCTGNSRTPSIDVTVSSIRFSVAYWCTSGFFSSQSYLKVAWLARLRSRHCSSEERRDSGTRNGRGVRHPLII